MVKAELQLVGARQISVDLKKQTVSAVFDPARTDLAAMRTVLDRMGYRHKTETVVEGPGAL